MAERLPWLSTLLRGINPREALRFAWHAASGERAVRASILEHRFYAESAARQFGRRCGFLTQRARSAASLRAELTRRLGPQTFSNGTLLCEACRDRGILSESSCSISRARRSRTTSRISRRCSAAARRSFDTRRLLQRRRQDATSSRLTSTPCALGGDLARGNQLRSIRGTPPLYALSCRARRSAGRARSAAEARSPCDGKCAARRVAAFARRCVFYGRRGPACGRVCVSRASARALRRSGTTARSLPPWSLGR